MRTIRTKGELLRDASEAATRRAGRVYALVSFVAAMPGELRLDALLIESVLVLRREDGDDLAIEAWPTYLTIRHSGYVEADQWFLKVRAPGYDADEVPFETVTVGEAWSFLSAWLGASR